MSKDNVRILILEDDEERVSAFRRRYPQAVIVKSATDCIKLLSEEWDLVYLDHDLGTATFGTTKREDCGYEIVRHIQEHKPENLKPTEFVVHSSNPVGAKRMIDDLGRAGYNATHVPFTELLRTFGA